MEERLERRRLAKEKLEEAKKAAEKERLEKAKPKTASANRCAVYFLLFPQSSKLADAQIHKTLTHPCTRRPSRDQVASMEARRLKAEQRAAGRRSAAEDKEREPERQKELAKQMILEAKVCRGLYATNGYQRPPRIEQTMTLASTFVPNHHLKAKAKAERKCEKEQQAAAASPPIVPPPPRPPSPVASLPRCETNNMVVIFDNMLIAQTDGRMSHLIGPTTKDYPS